MKLRAASSIRSPYSATTPANVMSASAAAHISMPPCVMYMSRRRSIASAITPLMSENTMIGTTRTSPTMPSAMPRWISGTSSDTSHRIAAFCIIEPAIETSWLDHSSRKFRCARDANGESVGRVGMSAGIGDRNGVSVGAGHDGIASGIAQMHGR